MTTTSHQDDDRRCRRAGLDRRRGPRAAPADRPHRSRPPGRDRRPGTADPPALPRRSPRRRGRRPHRTTPHPAHQRRQVPAAETARGLQRRRRPHASSPPPSGHLAAGHYMDAGEPVVLLGDSGTGKSHLLIGLGLAACEQGRRVRYVTTAQLVNELVEAADERRPVPRRRPLRTPRPALPRRARLRPNRPTRRRAAVPDHHRTRRTSLHRDRHQPAVQRMGHRVPRPAPRRRHRRPRHLQRPHPRNRHPVLPTTHQQDHRPPQTSTLAIEAIKQVER